MTDVFYLLRFFLTMPSRDTDHTPASSRTEASKGVDGRVGSLSRAFLNTFCYGTYEFCARLLVHDKVKMRARTRYFKYRDAA